MAKKIEETPRMKMGCDLLDILVGGDKGVYGLPFGSILNLYGDSASGKSLLKNEIIAANYWALGGEKGDLVWESDDCESGDTFDTTRLYGFDIHPAERRIGTKRVEDSDTVEKLDAKVSLMIEAMPEGKFGIYAVDSIDGLSDATREAMETGRMNQLKAGKDVQDPGDYGAQIAKFLSQQFFRTKHKKLEDAQISLIIVSQVRENMGAGMYAPKTKTGNGKALEFYCHTRIQLKTVAKIMKNDRWVGSYVKATTIKSKTPRPFRDVFYTVYFDYGIDNVGSNLDYLFDLRNSKGELIKSSCEHIAWSADAKSKDLTTLKEWLEQNGWTGDCKADRKAAEGSNVLSVDWILRWASSDPDRKSSFEGYFGPEYTREELVRMCDSDKEMAAELTRRVRQKWEAAEDAVATGRPSKYGN